MIKLLALTLIVKNSIFMGVVENPHYVSGFSSNEGYYIENDLKLEKGSKVIIVNEQVYVIEGEEK